MLTDTDYETHLYLDAIWRRRYIAYLCLLIMPILAVLGSYLLPQKYKASTALAINVNALPAMKDISSPIDVGDRFQVLKAYVLAPTTLQKIVVDAGMLKSSSKPSLIKSAADDLAKSFDITLLDKNVIHIQLIQNSPKHMVDILNAASSMMIKQFTAQEFGTTQTSIDLLSQALNKQQQQLQDSIAALNQFETAHSELLPQYSDIYQNQLRQIDNSLSAKQALLTSLKAEKQELEQSLLKINPVAIQLDRAMLENDIKLSKLRLVYTENYAEIKALLQLNASLKAERSRLEQQFKELDKDKIQQLWNMSISVTSSNEKNNSPFLSTQLEKLLGMQLQIKGLSQEIISLSDQQASIHKKLRLINDNGIAFNNLKQRIKTNQASYDDLLNRLNLARMSAGLNKDEKSNAIKVVSYPEYPTTSLSRPLSFFLFLGIIAGILLGISLPIALELLDNMARTKRGLKTATGFDVICRVERLRTE